jgi:PKD repeat protein
MTLLKQLVALVVLLLPISMHAQEKITAQPVSPQSAPSLSHIFKKYALFEINTVTLDQYMKQAGQGNIPLELNLPGFASFPMNLQPHDILSNDYKLVVGSPQGRQEFPKPACMTYQGILTNQGSSNVYLTINNDLIYGMLSGSSQSWFIEPLQYFDKQVNANVYVVYDTRDVLPRTDLSCGVSEIQTRQITNNSTARIEGTATGTCKMVDVAIASDDSMVYRYGNAARVQEHNIGVLNTMVGLYSNAQFTPALYLEFRIVGQYVSTALANNALTPLYTGQDATILLSDFTTWGQAGNFGFTYDMATYWTTKNITDNTGNTAVIGLAYLNAVCTSFKYQILEDLAGMTAAQLGALQTHETGHNFGANHDAAGAPYIMAPSINNPPATLFSATSISSISSYLGQPGVNCLSPCNTIMPVAQFNASAPNVCTGNSITFTNYSVGQITGVSWTFQDGTPATSTNGSETVTFSTPGIKTIMLTATNANGTNTVIKTVFVGAPLSGTGCRTGTTGGAGYGAFYNFAMQNISYSTGTILIGDLYKDFTCSGTTNLLPNTTYSGSSRIGLDFPPTYVYSSNMQLFIDYNNDGDFLDAGENVYNTAACSNGQFNFSFTTPATVPVMDAYLRMRAVTTPCTVISTNGCAIPPNSHVLDFGVYFSSSAALPLLLTNFDGYYNNGKNELNWTTETEVETDHFIVERSIDGNTYVEVGNMPARGLTNTLTNYYQFTDASLNAQTVNRFYYRLKMVDKNGAFTYSKSVAITRPNESGRVQVLVYPNPVLRNTTLQIKKATNELSVIEIFNSMGQKVYAKRLTAALFNTTVDIPGNWGAGIYIIRITDNKESWSGSVLIK